MNVNRIPATSRQFVAQPPFWGSKMASRTTPGWQKNPGKSYGIMVAVCLAIAIGLGILFVGMQAVLPPDVAETVARSIQPVGLFVLFGGAGAWYWWSRRRKILISATGDGLTVNTRQGDVYSFNGATLGTWGQTGGMTMGTALHLQCGQRRFVLGGRDHRVAAGTRLDAPDVGYGLEVDVDAHLSAAEFAEILSMVGRRIGVQIRPPAPAERGRCLLFTNPLLVQEFGPFAYRKRQQFMQSLGRPRLAIDVGADSIRVVDPNTNALIASVSPAQVTATPVVFRPARWHLLLTYGHFLGDLMYNYWSTALGMHVNMPGMPPLTISCRDTVSGLDHRFSWVGNVPTEHSRADYEVSGTDWLTLVEKFGLALYLKNRGNIAAS